MKRQYKEKIVRFIKFIERDKTKITNPIHVFFIIFLLFPILFLNKNGNILVLYFWIFYILFLFFIIFLKYLLKNEFKEDIEDFKNSIPIFGLPDGINLFHIILFFLLASPFLFFIYSIIDFLIRGK